VSVPVSPGRESGGTALKAYTVELTSVTLEGIVWPMGKVRRGGYIFVTWKAITSQARARLSGWSAGSKMGLG
jgi:hypothetical protein